MWSSVIEGGQVIAIKASSNSRPDALRHIPIIPKITMINNYIAISGGEVATPRTSISFCLELWIKISSPAATGYRFFSGD